MANILRDGLYTNTAGSLLWMAREGEVLRGWYQSGDGQPQPDERFALTGFSNGDLVGWVVLWGKHLSLTSWAGRCELQDGVCHIKTVWHLARTYADRAHQQENGLWESFVTNHGHYWWVAETFDAYMEKR